MKEELITEKTLRYYDKTTRTETSEKTDISEESEAFGWWFEPLAEDEMVVYSDEGLPYKCKVNAFYRPVVKNKTVVEGMSAKEILQREKKRRFATLTHIFNKKTLGLKKIAIDKPWMDSSEAVENQYRVYEEMYRNAKAKRYDDATNKSIVEANEAMQVALAEITLLLNTIRSVLERAIERNHEDVETLLQAAADISLTKEEITDEKIAEIKAIFGL